MDDSFINEMSTPPDVSATIELESLIGEHNRTETKEYKNFLEQTYYYYQGCGWKPIVIRQLLNLFNCFFQLTFSFVLFFTFDWVALLRCEEECGDLVDYFHYTPGFVGPVYLGVGIVYLLYRTIKAFKILRRMRRIHKLFLSKEIEENIVNMSWEAFYRKMGIQLLPQDVAQKIMQYDNFIIGIINNGLVQTKFNKRPIFNSQLEGILRHCLFNVDDFAWHTTKKLKHRFRLIGWLYALALPVIFPLTVIYTISRNVDIFYIQKQYLGPRTYPLQKIWFMRQYNELPHFLFRRLKQSEVHLNKYFNNVRSPLHEKIARSVQVFSGTMLMFLIIISALDESLLLELTIFGKSVLWQLALWTTVSTFARSYLPVVISEHRLETMLLDWSGYSHYLPDSWYRDPISNDTYRTLETFFPFKLNKILYDLWGCVLTPYLLIRCWPNRAGDVIDFIQQNSYTVDGLGRMCTLGVFNLNMYGNEKYGPFKGSHSGYSKTGKMEKSVINFGMNYEEEKDNVIRIFPERFPDGEINMKSYISELTQ